MNTKNYLKWNRALRLLLMNIQHAVVYCCQYLIFRYASQLCCTELARSPFVLTEHIYSEIFSKRIKVDVWSYIYYKYSTLERVISINVVRKVGIFHLAAGQGKYSLPRVNIINIPQGTVEYFFYYIR